MFFFLYISVNKITKLFCQWILCGKYSLYQDFISVDTVSGIVDQLVRFGKVTRPILGTKFALDQSVKQFGVSEVLVYAANGFVGKVGLLPTKRDAYGRLILGDIITMEKRFLMEVLVQNSWTM